MKPVPHGEPYAGKLHVRFDEGADVPCGGVSPYSTPQWWCRCGGVVAEYTIMRGMRALRNLKPEDVMAWLIENDGIDFLTKGDESMGKQRLLGRKVIPMAARAVSFYCSPDAAVMFKGQKPSH